MPRIVASNAEPFDFCRCCFPDPGEAAREFSRREDGPDGRGNCYEYNAEHPPYETTDYTCEDCNSPLTDEDDDIEEA
jgi:hypothetical protein